MISIINREHIINHQSCLYSNTNVHLFALLLIGLFEKSREVAVIWYYVIGRGDLEEVLSIPIGCNRRLHVNIYSAAFVVVTFSHRSPCL